MCGIVGELDFVAGAVEADLLERMLGLLHHRGPDDSGIFLDDYLGMGSVRLSIIDHATGQQPMSNEDGSVWIVFNGEIYNYVELSAELRASGHTLRTNSDTETIIHLYEELGEQCVHKLNGQFAFAIWDRRKEELFLARDRVGIRPLFYVRKGNGLIFASEIKAILAHPDVTPQIDPMALDQIFTFWTTLTPRTIFQKVYELPPGHTMIIGRKRHSIRPYWQLQFPSVDQIRERSIDDAAEQFMQLFQDSIRLRLRADVPVGAYLSGGIDSAATTAMILKTASNDLRTFSVSFDDKEFDESHYQRQAIDYLGTNHSQIRCKHEDIGRILPSIIWHAETPILRTAPAPIYLLSRLVREHGFKVVVTGEGADEILAGYNIFKEAIVRHFWARVPNSEIRPLLLRKLYPYIPQIQRAGANVLRTFFGHGLTDSSDPVYSHTLRWRNTGRIKQFFSHSFREQIGDYDPVDEIRERVKARFQDWPPLSRAQHLETTIFMSGYLLSSQGDRMAMANSVEGRYPFLDHRLIQFCAELPPALKLHGLTEKWLLKYSMRGKLPNSIVARSKQPYRAPIAESLMAPDSAEIIQEQLSSAQIKTTGIFSPQAVARLVAKASSSRPLSETENMALMGILSTQLVTQLFCREPDRYTRQNPPPIRRIIRSRKQQEPHLQ